MKIVRWVWILIGFFAYHTLEAQDFDNGDIRGFVYNAENGDRLGNAQVFVSPEDVLTQTDEDGFFAVTKLTPGEYTVVCFKNGFDTFIKQVTVYPGANAKKTFT